MLTTLIALLINFTRPQTDFDEIAAFTLGVIHSQDENRPQDDGKRAFIRKEFNV